MLPHHQAVRGIKRDIERVFRCLFSSGTRIIHHHIIIVIARLILSINLTDRPCPGLIFIYAGAENHLLLLRQHLHITLADSPFYPKIPNSKHCHISGIFLWGIITAARLIDGFNYPCNFARHHSIVNTLLLLFHLCFLTLDVIFCLLNTVLFFLNLCRILKFLIGRRGISLFGKLGDLRSEISNLILHPL